MKYLLLILFFRFTACEDNHSTKPHHLDNEFNLVIDSVERWPSKQTFKDAPVFTLTGDGTTAGHLTLASPAISIPIRKSLPVVMQLWDYPEPRWVHGYGTTLDDINYKFFNQNKTPVNSIVMRWTVK